MTFREPTTWRVKDLTVGQVIYCPPRQEIDPLTRQTTGRLQKFIVTAIHEGYAEFEPYRGDREAEMPPDA